MGSRTVRRLARRLVESGAVAPEKADAVLAGIGEWSADHLDEELAERDLLGWLPDFGVAVAVHAEDVDSVGDYYRHLLETEVAACLGGSVVFSDVALVRLGDGAEKLHFRRDGESFWWHVEHLSDDYADTGSVAEQFNDLDPGGADRRVFRQVRRTKGEVSGDDVFVLSTPEQARVLREEFGLEFCAGFHGPGGRPGGFVERWRADMAGELDRWRARFGLAGFDFSVGSLDALEEVARDRGEDESFLGGAVRYFGEVLVRAGAGHWGERVVEGLSGARAVVIRSTTPAAFQVVVVPWDELRAVAEGSGVLREAARRLWSAADRYAEGLRALDGLGREAAV